MSEASVDEDTLLGRVMAERYRIEEPLGQGGIGRVYKARHLTLGRMVALKVLLAQYETVDVLKKRFAREAEALAALSHPNIVTVTDYGVEDDLPYIVMELLEGKDLAELLDEPEPLEPKRTLDIMRQSLRALSYAHDQGLVHRDLKPHNIFVRDLGHGQEHVFVLDFGLARFVGNQAPKGPKLTRQGALIGTPAYMAPEQASGEDVDVRADIYAMGCVFFEALTGQRPFATNDPGQLLRAHLLSPPPSLAAVDPGLRCSDRLEALIARCLEKSPAARYQTAPELLDAIDALGPDDCVRVGPRPPPGSMVSGIAPTQAGATRAASPSARAAGSANGPSGPYATGGASALPSAASVSLPANRTPLFVGIGCLALGAIALLGAILWVTVLDGDDDADAGDRDPPAVVAPTPAPTVPPAPTPSAPSLPPIPNPMDLLPEPLRAFAERRGSPTDAEKRQINRLIREQDDPRFAMYAHLILAHREAEGERHLRDAMRQYLEALRLDHDNRLSFGALGDPLLYEHVLEAECTSTPQTHAAARPVRNLIPRERFLPYLRAAAEAESEGARGFPCTSPERLDALLAEYTAPPG